MVDKRPIGVIAGKADYLEKKVPKNPKFAHVTSTLNTGTHANHIEVQSDMSIAKRKGELFRRIRPSTLANLLKKETNEESIYNLVGTNTNEHQDTMDDNQSVYSAFTSKSGYSEASKFSSITSAMEKLVIGDNSEFLLLDLREPEDFEAWHIREAISYPAPNLGRDKVIPELFKFKNKEGKLIIVYHLDERNSIPHANLMSQKGYDNIYMLTSGIEGFLENYSQYVEGKNVPEPPKKVETKKTTIKRSANPESGDVSSKHFEEQKSMVSNQTRTSGMTSISKANSKTPSTLNKNVTKLWKPV